MYAASSSLLAVILSVIIALSGAGAVSPIPETATQTTIRDITVTLNDETYHIEAQPYFTQAIGTELAAGTFGVQLGNEALLPMQAAIDPNGIRLSGALTFKNAKHLIEVCRNVPADRLLLETDCPYMAPVPLRGRRNEPAYITHTLACAACVRGVSPEALAERTYQNALSVFEITEEEAFGSTNPI